MKHEDNSSFPSRSTTSLLRRPFVLRMSTSTAPFSLTTTRLVEILEEALNILNDAPLEDALDQICRHEDQQGAPSNSSSSSTEELTQETSDRQETPQQPPHNSRIP